jgi:hypothetical protein
MCLLDVARIQGGTLAVETKRAGLINVVQPVLGRRSQGDQIRRSG